MKTAALPLAFLAVLTRVPLIAQPPQLTPEAQAARQAQQAQMTQQALAAAKLPPVEDFKPSVLNQQGKWDLPLGRQRRSSPPSAPSSRTPITVEKGWPTSAPAMSSLVSAAPESVASYSTSKTGKLLPAEFMNASASKQPVLTWTANARESKVARLVGIPVRTRRTSSPPVDRPAHWPQTAFEEIMMSPASPGCALPQRRLGARVAR